MNQGNRVLAYTAFAVVVSFAVLLFVGYAFSAWENVAELWKGYELSPGDKEWMRRAKLPNGATNCCGDADGIPIDWSIKDGHYWGNWDGGWRQIPDDKILHNGKTKFPVLWVTPGNHMTPDHIDAGYRGVRCFWPGPTS